MKPLMIRMNWTELPSPQKARKSVFVGLCGFVWVCVRVRVCVWERERGEREKKKHFNKVKLSNKIIEWNLIGPIVFHSWIFMFLSSEKKLNLRQMSTFPFVQFFHILIFFPRFPGPRSRLLKNRIQARKTPWHSVQLAYFEYWCTRAYTDTCWCILVHTGGYAFYLWQTSKFRYSGSRLTDS